MPQLRHILAEKSHLISLPEKTVHIGSLEENDIVLQGSRVPDIAAEITFERGVYSISTLQSSSVRINGKKCKTVILNPGDRIEIGKDIFIFDHTSNGKKAVQDPEYAANIFEKIAHFAEIVGRERDLRKLLSAIIRILIESVGGKDAFIFKLDTDKKPQIFVSSNGGVTEERFSDTIVQHALKLGEGILIPNALEDPELGSARSIADLQLTSVMCSPIKVADNIIGIIYLGAQKNTQTYSECDLNILNTFAVMAGTLINHVEFISQQRNTIRKLTEYSTYYEGIIAESKGMHDILESMDSLADSDIGILVEGETGTGKDLIAKFIHKKSSRSQKPMVVVNCSSIQKDLQESELFGHIKGSFTGAVNDHRGLFATANGGTLFLDEIGDMDITLQAKFLRALETGKIRPVGSSYENDVDVRIICATNKNLEEMVEEGAFRKDLYYRINQFRYRLPPLRDRGEDCIHLAYYFLEKYKAEYPNRKVIDFHPDAIKFIKSYSWPGNVRELASAVHKTVLSSSSPLGSLDIATTSYEAQFMTFEDATKEFQKQLIKKTLKSTGGNKEQAARILGLGRSTFFRYISSMEIQ